MPRLLHIQASPNTGNSVTRALSDRFVETWSANPANVAIDAIDLPQTPCPISMGRR